MDNRSAYVVEIKQRRTGKARFYCKTTKRGALSTAWTLAGAKLFQDIWQAWGIVGMARMKGHSAAVRVLRLNGETEFVEPHQ